MEGTFWRVPDRFERTPPELTIQATISAGTVRRGLQKKKKKNFGYQKPGRANRLSFENLIYDLVGNSRSISRGHFTASRS